MDQMRDAVARSERDLDDVSKARLWAKLEPDVEKITRDRRPLFSRELWRGFAFAVGGAGVAAVLLWSTADRAPTTAAKPVGVGAPVAPVTTSPPMLQPASQHFEVAANDTMRARLDDRTYVVLRGPASLTVSAREPVLELALARGRLEVTHTPVAGASIQVILPGDVHTEGGSRFAVHVSANEREVLVAAGEVRVVANNKTLLLGDAESWRSSTVEKRKKVVAVAPPRPPKPALVTAETLYGRAEAAMRKNDHESARRLLMTVVGDHASDPLAHTARYELARLSAIAGRPASAEQHITALLNGPVGPQTESARALRCRVRASDPSAGAACWQAFRREHPNSPHEAEALAFFASHTHAQDGCQKAVPLFSEYLRRFPDRPFARQAQARIFACTREK